MASLPELQGSFPERDLTLPILGPHSPFSFLTACLRLACVICKLHKGLISEVIVMLLSFFICLIVHFLNNNFLTIIC